MRNLVEQSQLSRLQTQNFKGTNDEWEAILVRLLLGDGLEPNTTGLDGLEMVAAVASAKMVLSIRQNVAGITVRIEREHAR